MMAVNKIRVRNLADAGLSSAQTLMKVLDNQPKMLSAILIGNNIVNISASSLATILVTRAFGDMYVGVGTGILTLLGLIFGEITPKPSATDRQKVKSARGVMRPGVSRKKRTNA